MAKRKSFYQQEYQRHIGATVLLITSFMAAAFMICGTPLGVLMTRDRTNDERSCYTLWGFKRNCWNADYHKRVEEDTCKERRLRFEAAEAFSIIAIFAIFGVFGAAWYKICGSEIKLLTTVMGFFALGSTTVPWAVVTALYYSFYCGENTFTREKMRYGDGYILILTSFCIQCVGLLVFMFVEPETAMPVKEAAPQDSSDSASATSNEPITK